MTPPPTPAVGAGGRTDRDTIRAAEDAAQAAFRRVAERRAKVNEARRSLTQACREYRAAWARLEAARAATPTPETR